MKTYRSHIIDAAYGDTVAAFGAVNSKQRPYGIKDSRLRRLQRLNKYVKRSA